jgi:hypothetical protein
VYDIRNAANLKRLRVDLIGSSFQSRMRRTWIPHVGLVPVDEHDLPEGNSSLRLHRHYRTCIVTT